MSTDDVAGRLLDACRAAGLDVTLREASRGAWDRVWAAVPYQPVDQSEANLRYQLAYWRGQGGEWTDVSMVIRQGGQPVALWPVTIALRDGRWSLTTAGSGLLGPLFARDCPVRAQKQVVRGAIETLAGFAAANGVAPLIATEPFLADHGCSEWYQEFRRRGATVTVSDECFLDLGADLETIRSHFRKSYKPLISSGLRMWKVEVMSTADQVIWDEFRALHLSVAGRVTRSAESWDVQHDTIRDGSAFLVHLRDGAGRMVGAGLFTHTRDEGAYSVAAYDRELFDKPLGHVVQYTAIQVLKERGIRWYRIGLRHAPGDRPAPTPKELQIADFKHGFASHLMPRHFLTL